MYRCGVQRNPRPRNAAKISGLDLNTVSDLIKSKVEVLSTIQRKYYLVVIERTSGIEACALLCVLPDASMMGLEARSWSTGRPIVFQLRPKFGTNCWKRPIPLR